MKKKVTENLWEKLVDFKGENAIFGFENIKIEFQAK